MVSCRKNHEVDIDSKIKSEQTRDPDLLKLVSYFKLFGEWWVIPSAKRSTESCVAGCTSYEDR